MLFFWITPKRCDANLIDAMKISWINEQHFMENYDCSTKIAWLLIAGIHAILISWIHAIAGILCNIDQLMFLRCWLTGNKRVWDWRPILSNESLFESSWWGSSQSIFDIGWIILPYSSFSWSAVVMLGWVMLGYIGLVKLGWFSCQVVSCLCYLG